MADHQALAGFSPAVREWFATSFPEPTAAQVQGWPAIVGGRHTLVCAPESPGPFASAVAGLFVVEALAAYVAAGTPGGTERRLGAAQELWARFGTY